MFILENPRERSKIFEENDRFRNELQGGSAESQATGSQAAQPTQFSATEVRNLPCFNPREDPNTLSVRWKCWKRSFEPYVLAKGISSDPQKVALLLHTAGTELQELYYMLAATEGELKPYKDVIKILDEYFVPTES